MNFPFFIAASVLLLVGAYQVWVTFRLAKAVEYSRVQKLSQFALIWLIPILGAALVHFVLSSGGQPERPADRAFIRQDENHPDYPPFVGHDD